MSSAITAPPPSPTFCKECISTPCEGICKIDNQYCDDCGRSPCDGCCRKGPPRPAKQERIARDVEQAIRHVFSNEKEYVELFEKRFAEEMVKRHGR